jgi:hypothetical protein
MKHTQLDSSQAMHQSILHLQAEYSKLSGVISTFVHCVFIIYRPKVILLVMNEPEKGYDEHIQQEQTLSISFYLQTRHAAL